MTLKTPRSIQTEHEELHEKLTKATESGGETQKAAIVVADLLHEHFVDEEAYAMPPLPFSPRLHRVRCRRMPGLQSR